MASAQLLAGPVRLAGLLTAGRAPRHHVAKKQRGFGHCAAFGLATIRASVAYMAKWLRC
jgi:hypothetical protein